ncbi:hypothetical protein Tco_1090379 [Tanacetum coccineum]|uniref:Uncharacterized protein n=1 Tax=Tanacetum coccineum TaxID=301880 RepID=A0ABQ5I414_9ASTR
MRNSGAGRDQRNRGQQSHRAANSGSQQNKAQSEGYTYPRDCKKNTGASSSGYADKKPDASGRVFALTQDQAANATANCFEFQDGSRAISRLLFAWLPIELKELKDPVASVVGSAGFYTPKCISHWECTSFCSSRKDGRLHEIVNRTTVELNLITIDRYSPPPSIENLFDASGALSYVYRTDPCTSNGGFDDRRIGRDVRSKKSVSDFTVHIAIVSDRDPRFTSRFGKVYRTLGEPGLKFSRFSSRDSRRAVRNVLIQTLGGTCYDHCALEWDRNWVRIFRPFSKDILSIHDSFPKNCYASPFLSVMSSASFAVTYTSVYTDSEPGRAFWGANEEIPNGGYPRVIVYGYDGLPMQPAHDPDYVLEPMYPEYIPLKDEHVFLVEERPLPLVDSPTAELPGYVAELDPEEDPEEY